MAPPPPPTTTFLLLLSFSIPIAVSAQTLVGFYHSSCPFAEIIVRKTVESHFNADPTVAAALLRMHFHDCFIRGCDASILLDGDSAEKTAPPNLSVRGYEVIDDAKTQLENACPGTVSCSDIIALAARDSVSLSGGSWWSVATGRRDGNVSMASEVSGQLPSPLDSINVQKQKFTAKGLSTQDMVTLVGAHTIGMTSCQFVSYRLYNYTGRGDSDESIDAKFLEEMKKICAYNGDGGKRVGLDNGSANVFDLSFFENVKNGKGVLESDQKLWSDASTRPLVQRFLATVRGMVGFRFNIEFGLAMAKMGNVEVMTGREGEIRKICSAIN